MIIGISFISTDMKYLKKLWKENSSNGKVAGDNVGLTGILPNEKGVEPFLGGKLIFLNWENKKVIWEIDIDSPAGFIIVDDKLYLNNARLHYISVVDLKTKTEIKRISNKAFNCLHTIEKTSNGFLVASTGIDSIIEINDQGNALFEWWATDYGFDKLPNGSIRTIDKMLDHRSYVYPTLYHATHLNSATLYQEKFIITTLFYQGMLIKIDRQTGKHEVLLEGLKRPHGIKSFNDGWVLSNTQANQLCILDKGFNLVEVIQGDFDWVQDNCPIDHENVLLADANHHRVVEINAKTKKIKSEYKYSNDYRIYQISKINSVSSYLT